MGLDMYLNGKRFLWHTEGALKDAISSVLPDAPGIPSEVVVEVCYWRKANHIHRWFVEHAQGGKDDCGHYDVSRDLIKELVKVCKEVLANKDLAETLLPTESGFFFGSTEYDTGYFDDCEHTIKMLKPLIKPDSYKGWDFEYHSSW